MNIIKSISLFFVFVLLWFWSVFANEDINLQISQSQLEVGDTFDVAIELKNQLSQGQNLQISIAWIDNFDVLSQSQVSNTQSINGVTSSVLSFSMRLTAPVVWKFTIGPVTILKNWKEFQDDTVFPLEVVEEWSLTPSNTPTQNPSSSDISTPSASETLSWSTDDDIKDLRREGFPFMLLIFWLLFFIVLFSLLIRYYITPKNTSEKEVVFTAPTQSYYDKKLAQVEQLRWEKERVSQQDFFRKFNHIIRDIFSHEGFSIVESASLQELLQRENIQESELFDIYQKSYYKEFSQNEDMSTLQDSFVNDLCHYLKNK